MPRYLLSMTLAFLLLSAPIVAGEKVRQKLYITNSAGNDITVADVLTNKVIGRIEVGAKPHGIAAPASQDLLLVTIEGTNPGELVWIDPRADKIMRRMPIGPAPNQLAVTPDGKFAYIPVSDGYYEVVDILKAKMIERIFTGGRPHNTICSANGERMYLAPMGNPKKVSIVSVAAHKVIQEKIAGARLEILKSAAHLSNMEQPDAFNKALTTFLSSL